MAERPIPFSGAMVRAILAGTKTQTRRVCKSQPSERFALGGYSRVVEGLTVWGARCPYGVPGDRLWVREAWAAPHCCDHLKPSEIPPGTRIHYSATEGRGGLRGRPGMFMPRWASRLTLEVTEVRVERLQDTSEADAKAEGIERSGECNWRHYLDPHDDRTTARGSYRTLWESINGLGSWEANPWVWVVGIKRVEVAHG